MKTTGSGPDAPLAKGDRAKYVTPSAANDVAGEMAVTLTRGQLAALVSAAVAEALGAQAAPALLDRQRLAKALGCSAGHIDKMRKAGLPSLRLIEAVRFELPAVLAWLREHAQANDSE